MTGSSRRPGRRPRRRRWRSPRAPTGAPTPVAAAPPTASLELRDLLDPATVADIRRLDRGRAPSSLAGAGAGGGRAAGPRRRARYARRRRCASAARTDADRARTAPRIHWRRMSRRWRRSRSSLLVTAAAARAQEDGAARHRALHASGRGRAGVSTRNAHRTEIVAGANNPPLVASPLERLVLAGALSDLVADGQVLTHGRDAGRQDLRRARRRRRGRRHRPVLAGLGKGRSAPAGDADPRRARTTRRSSARPPAWPTPSNGATSGRWRRRRS